ncbi:MAG: Coenzyme F420 hydrogenase/dehydrogenase, beta subunit C-terminal domain [Nitrospiraceae bacterium]|nr:MAG: Coenzyme F420 hydrogenase/dehydrogenase, beta subunit C-terminal domain [Nitrospiraceae bacterium]
MKRCDSVYDTTVEDVVRRGLCMGCGFCTASLKIENPDAGVSMGYDRQTDSFVPAVNRETPGAGRHDFICPGMTMDMVRLAEQVHGKIPDDPLLGTCRELRVCYAADEEVRHRAASGGVIPGVLKHLFETGRIDSAYCLHPGTDPYGAEGRIIQSAAELAGLHGSVYHPANFGKHLYDLYTSPGKFAYVGLPCQVAGLEMLKAKYPELARRHVLSLGLFCGGINTFSGIAYYLEGFRISWGDVERISYREGPWPGKIRVTSKSKGGDILIPRIRGNSRWKILRYIIAFQGYWMLKRCRLCPDQVNDFADIAVGDPHLAKYRAQGGAGFSATISRTERGEEMLKEMLSLGKIAGETVDREDLISSQGYTLDNRRHVTAYVRMAELLGESVPHISVYPELQKTVGVRHYIYAAVDLMKIVLPKNRVIRACYVPWQIFEYVFITFTPSLILRRLIKILRNK